MVIIAAGAPSAAGTPGVPAASAGTVDAAGIVVFGKGAYVGHAMIARAQAGQAEIIASAICR